MPELWQQLFIVLLIVMIFIAFLRDWLAVELVAFVAFVACIVTGILPLTLDPGLSPEEQLHQSKFLALSVFAHPAPITVACMFVLSAALERTGVVETLGTWFERVAATNPLRMLIVMMALVALLSGFVNNTPVVVVFMPIVLAICRRKDWKASRFLIPLSYAAIVGGTITIVGTSTNLVAAGTWADQHPEDPFALFEVAGLGIVFVAVTLLYMMTIGRRLLPDRITLAAMFDTDETQEFITHAFVRKGSALDGAPFLKTRIAKLTKVHVLEVLRDGVRLTIPLNELVLRGEDEIVFKGHVSSLLDLSADDQLQMRGDEALGLEGVRTESAVLMEGVVGPGSSFEGKSVRDLQFRQRYGVLILAVHRRGRHLQNRFEDEKLTFGDTLLVHGPAEKMNRLFELKDFINLSKPRGRVLRPSKAPLAVAGIGAFMAAGALVGFGVLPAIPVEALAMSAALFVLVTRCIEPKEAYGAIEWQVIFLIVGMLGLGKAVGSTGLDLRIGTLLTDVIGTEHPMLLIAVLYLTAALLTEVISNNAVAALLAPIAIGVGIQAGIDPKPLVVAIMFGASASFATPIGYQTNTFVYGAGGYKFGDFFRVGAPLAVILWIVASVLIPVMWPL